MNILLLTIAPKSKQKMNRDIAEELVKRGHCVFIVCPEDGLNRSSNKFVPIDGISYLFVKSNNTVGRIGIIRKAINTLCIDNAFQRGLRFVMSSINIDLILYSTPPITLANTVRKLKKKTNACTYLMLKDIFPQNAVDLGMLKKQGLVFPVWKYFRNKEKNLYKSSDYIGCMSPANCEYILQNNPELSNERIGICVNSYKEEPLIEIDKFEIRKKHGLPCDKLIFLYGGNLGKPQGLQFFLDVIDQNKDKNDRYFLICGNGNDQARIINYIENNRPNNVKYMSSLPADEFDVLSRACDVGLVFLDNRFTIPNFPSRLLSIMLNQMPILAATDINTDVNQMIFDSDSGWWCESRNPDEMTRIINIICSNRNKLIEKGKNARNYYLSHFTTEIACDQIEAGVKKVRPDLF